MQFDTNKLLDYSKAPRKVRTGVLYKEFPVLGGIVEPITQERIVANKPVYIVEHLMEPEDFDIAIVYAVQPKSKPPIKAFERKEIKSVYRNSTELGALASKQGIKGSKRYVEEKPPLFVAPIDQGVDSFTGDSCLGFYEREPDQYTAKGIIIEGKPTNVFVSLNSIQWEEPKILPSTVLNNFDLIRDMWFGI